jgi:phage/plasmid-like protein (TIGR03299 family)
MSQETAEWLNQNVLIGFTDRRGHAWHYRASKQGAEPNHYREAIPVPDVQRRLFNWEAVPAEVLTRSPQHGLRLTRRKGIIASDTGDDLGVFGRDYEIHQYQDWLVDKVVSVLDNGLSVGSAGLLKGRAQAWVSVELPENIRTREGVEYRPNLLACTSHDGSLKTTYKRTVINVVCDNTMGIALAGGGRVIKIKHSPNSRLDVLSAREALDVVTILGDDFAAQVRALCETEVPEKTWNEFVRAHVPDGESDRSKINASAHRAELHRLWTSDSRVEPWKGTAWGVVQAVNTYGHHYASVRGASRAQRAIEHTVTSHAEKTDNATLATLDKVLAAA